jgi:hypothetical protein
MVLEHMEVLKMDNIKRGKWSSAEIDFLTTYFPEKKGKWCAEQLNRGFHATHKMAKKLELKAVWSYEHHDNNGYIVDISDRNNKIYQHRKVMQEHLGRELLSEEIVHHLDGNKKNNSIENLELTTRSEHINIHRHDLQEGKR